MKRTHDSEQRFGAQLVAKLNPEEASKAADKEASGSDIYGTKQAEKRKQLLIKKKNLPEGFKPEMDVVESAAQTTSIRTDAEVNNVSSFQNQI